MPRILSRPLSALVAAIAFAATPAAHADDGAVPLVQGLWWAGPQENGWGVILMQHEDRVFCALAVYDTIAHTTWFVAPSMTWDASRTVLRGAAYWPRAADLDHYSPFAFDPGPPLGEIQVQLDSSGGATMSYSLDVYSGSKPITPLFGPRAANAPDEHTDLWWGGPAQNGWGVAIFQQGDTVFGFWLTYYGPNHGEPAWIMFQPGSKTAPDTYSGAVARPFGPYWLGTTYDAQKLQSPNDGTYTLVFDGADHATLGYSSFVKGSLDLVRMPF